uniref:Uncharacterized protein n=1 Tax=Cacopsylla melanoneura TaxID=428564 RepID=A0A8D8TP13_9HEMI
MRVGTYIIFLMNVVVILIAIVSNHTAPNVVVASVFLGIKTMSRFKISNKVYKHARLHVHEILKFTASQVTYSVFIIFKSFLILIKLILLCRYLPTYHRTVQ